MRKKKQQNIYIIAKLGDTKPTSIILMTVDAIHKNREVHHNREKGLTMF